MAEEVARDKYKGSTIGEYDPIAAFLALKSITEADNSSTNLRKLGNIAGYQMESFPYVKGTVCVVLYNDIYACTKLNIGVFLNCDFTILLPCF